MSYYDYVKSQDLQAQDIPFYALIMAAMRKADTSNLYLLKSAFPVTYEELIQRYNAPGGALPEDT